jgi:F0F1-type ATP synthase membrane subunit b/b'
MKKAQEALREAQENLESVQKALKEAEEELSSLLQK